MNDQGPSRGIDWLTKNFRVDENVPMGKQWRFYFLDALAHVGQFSGERTIGTHDWYREGAEALVRDQSKDTGEWRGSFVEGDPTLATSFALMFLGRGRAPVLIQKAKHGPAGDWENDPDDVRNLIGTVARDWKRPLNWQIVDLDSATVDDLLLAPILFLNGHKSPELTDRGRKALLAYVERGGFIFAEACCGKREFDQGFRALIKEIFPAPESVLHPLAGDHPIWTARHNLKPDDLGLWGLQTAGKTVLVYSPVDLSCGWNTRDRYPDEARTVRAIRVGGNVVNYAIGLKLPPAGREALSRTPDVIGESEAEKTFRQGAYYKRVGKLASAEYFFGKVSRRLAGQPLGRQGEGRGVSALDCVRPSRTGEVSAGAGPGSWQLWAGDPR